MVIIKVMQDHKEGVYACVIFLWVLAGLWWLFVQPKVAIMLTAGEESFWFMFAIGLPLLMLWALRHNRKWGGWLIMVYSMLVAIIALRLIMLVMQKGMIPDGALLILIPIVLVASTMFGHGKLVHRFLWQASESPPAVVDEASDQALPQKAAKT